MPLPEILRRTIQIHNLVPPDSLVVVAVSGGADSLCLLHALHQIHTTLDFSLHAASLNHGLRGEAGAEDARFVQQIARRWGIPVTLGEADVNAVAQRYHLSIEVAARQARYQFLSAVAHQQGALVVATAHHADDQAETVLMRLLRGTGLRGLRGMAFKSSLPSDPEVALIRPLLQVSRAEIEDYCREHQLQPRHDLTNEDTTLTRNYIRRETLPHLRNLNPRVERSLMQLADVVSVEDDFVDQQFRQSVASNAVITENRIALDRRAFRDLHPALQRRFIHWAVGQLIGENYDTGYEHITAAVALGAHGQTGAIALLSSGLRLRVDYAAIVVERDDVARETETLAMPIESEIAVSVPGLTLIPGYSWRLRADLAPIENWQAQLAVSEDCKISLRARKFGDVFAPFGLHGHTQRVKKWMVDHKVPQSLRDSVPLLIIDGQIAAILYGQQWAISHHFSVTPNSRQVVYMIAER